MRIYWDSLCGKFPNINPFYYYHLLLLFRNSLQDQRVFDLKRQDTGMHGKKCFCIKCWSPPKTFHKKSILTLNRDHYCNNNYLPAQIIFDLALVEWVVHEISVNRIIAGATKIDFSFLKISQKSFLQWNELHGRYNSIGHLLWWNYISSI